MFDTFGRELKSDIVADAGSCAKQDKSACHLGMLEVLSIKCFARWKASLCSWREASTLYFSLVVVHAFNHNVVKSFVGLAHYYLAAYE